MDDWDALFEPHDQRGEWERGARVGTWIGFVIGVVVTVAFFASIGLFR